MTTPDRKHKVPVRARGLGVSVPKACPSHKHSWLSRQHAVQASRRAEGSYGQPYRVYRCRGCRQYHLTSRVDR
jgi:hypothetical protein